LGKRFGEGAAYYVQFFVIVGCRGSGGSRRVHRAGDRYDHRYERSRDRGAALSVLRRSARERVTHAFDLPPDTDRTVLVPALAERTGYPADEIDALLFGRDPETDEELVATAAALETLVAAVTRIPEGEPRD